MNNISGFFHTQNVLNGYSNTRDIEVLDDVTFVGNTTGTGNHTEVRSTVLVRAEIPSTIKYWTNCDNYEIYPLFHKIPEEKLNRWDRDLELPDESAGCYVVEVYGDVPFPDSIAGH